MSTDDLPHNPLKLALCVLGVLMGVGEIIGGLAGGLVWFAAVGILVLLLSLLGLRAVLQRRNPWYTRSPLDRYFVRRKQT
jgi:hypothetical protein